MRKVDTRGRCERSMLEVNTRYLVIMIMSNQRRENYIGFRSGTPISSFQSISDHSKALSVLEMTFELHPRQF